MTRPRFLGALPALVSGLLTIPAAYLVWQGSLQWIPTLAHGDILGLAVLPALALGLLVLLGVWCGLLTHSWWALVMTPLGYGLGWGVGFAIFAATGAGGNSANLELGTGILFVASTFVTLMLIPLVLGAAIGSIMAARRSQTPSQQSLAAANAS
jgi:hypothetical protein